MIKVKQKKIVVKKIEWLEVSFHLDEGKPEQCKENNLSGEFPRFCDKNTDYWNFDYAENGRTFWGVRLWCLTGEISAWSNFGVSSVGHLQFPCQTLPGHFGASSQSSLLATKSSTFEIILQLLFRLTKI